MHRWDGPKEGLVSIFIAFKQTVDSLQVFPLLGQRHIEVEREREREVERERCAHTRTHADTHTHTHTHTRTQVHNHWLDLFFIVNLATYTAPFP